jgi:Fic family protein
MDRLVSELNSEAFAAAHPAVQSAFAHHALVAVHPFQDGNGRTARALSAIYTLRAHRIAPLMLTEFDAEYVPALRRADADDYLPFVDFIVRCCLGTARRRFASRLIAESFSIEAAG